MRFIETVIKAIGEHSNPSVQFDIEVSDMLDDAIAHAIEIQRKLDDVKSDVVAAQLN